MYFPLLDLARFLSAVAVFFHHTFDFHYGKLGVYFFFIISGFVIYFSLNKGIKNYVIGRFIRLYPLFWVCCTITYLITLGYDANLSLGLYLKSMLLFNDGKIALLVDGSYWTLTFELLFYFYIGTFAWLFGVKRLEWFFIGWLGISFFSFLFHVDQHIIMKLLAVRFAPYFVFGGMLALIVERYKTSSVAHKIAYITTLIASALLPLYISSALRAQQGLIHNFTGSFELDEMLIVEGLFIVIPALVAISLLPIFKGKTFSKMSLFLGAITYPLYLLHWKIGDTIITAHGQLYGTVSSFTVTVAAGIFILATVLAVYDAKFRKLIRKK